MIAFSGVSLLCSAVLSVAVAAPQIAVVPDTQNYTNNESRHGIMRQQIGWVADNVEAENIVFMTHLGDIVSARIARVTRAKQWSVASDIFDLLVDRLPYSAAYGNHDFDTMGQSSDGAIDAQGYFGVARYASKDWFVGASPDGTNFAQVFELSGIELLHITIKFKPDEESYSWAQEVLDANPGKPTIVSTHAYLTDSGTALRGNDLVEAGYDSIGQKIWNFLVRKNDQIFMVIGGHNHAGDNVEISGDFSDDGEYHQISINDSGNAVYEILANYQDYPNGGDGWLQLMALDVENGRIDVQTYSPFLDKYQDDAGSLYSWDVDLKDRWRLE
ncbi:MAG: hypothetical protein HOM55_07670 [Proteobacteria bacterium]|nr:hypothetical protein [Pseudomonadota bacterium]